MNQQTIKHAHRERGQRGDRKVGNRRGNLRASWANPTSSSTTCPATGFPPNRPEVGDERPSTRSRRRRFRLPRVFGSNSGFVRNERFFRGYAVTDPRIEACEFGTVPTSPVEEKGVSWRKVWREKRKREVVKDEEEDMKNGSSIHLFH